MFKIMLICSAWTNTQNRIKIIFIICETYFRDLSIVENRYFVDFKDDFNPLHDSNADSQCYPWNLNLINNVQDIVDNSKIFSYKSHFFRETKILNN